MMLDVTFGASPLEEYLASCVRPTAANILALCDGEEELQQALEQGIDVDLSDLPAFSDYSAAARRLAVEAQLKKPEELLQFGADDPLTMYMEELASIPVCGDEHPSCGRCPTDRHSSRAWGCPA